MINYGSLLASCMSVAMATLSVTPSNQVVSVGSSVTFTCASSNDTAGISWSFYSLTTPSMNCVIYYHGRPSLADCQNPYRYNTTTSSGHCTMSIPNTQYADAGTYVCTDLTSTASVSSAILGIIGVPVVSSNPSDDCLTEGQNVLLSCQITYNGSGAMPLLMTWRSSDGQQVNGVVTNSTGRFQSNLSITATTPDISPFTCTVSFASPSVTSTIPSTVPATNAPSYTNTTSTPLRRVHYCPSAVTISSYSPSTVLCASNGFPEPVYIWTNLTDNSTKYGQRLAPKWAGDYGMACTAVSNFTDCDGNVHLCHKTASVVVKVYFTQPGETFNPNQTSVGPVVIDDITPKRHIITGGTTVYLIGRNLNIVRKAELILTMVYSHQSINDVQRVSETTEFISRPCVINNSTLMTCILPIIVLPSEFRNFTDANLTFPFNNGRTKRSSADRHSAIILSHLYQGEESAAAVRHRNRRLISSYSQRNSSIDFFEHVRIDGVIYPWNRSNDLQFISLLPTITNSGTQRFDLLKPTLASIKGDHLTRGVTVASDYTVSFGSGQCRPQGQLTDNLFYCEPPRIEPNKTNTDGDFCNGNLALVVKVGVHTLGVAGCVEYYRLTDEIIRLKKIAIGVGVGVGLFLLIIIIITTAACVYKFRHSKGHNRSLATGHKLDNELDVLSDADAETNAGYSRHIEPESRSLNYTTHIDQPSQDGAGYTTHVERPLVALETSSGYTTHIEEPNGDSANNDSGDGAMTLHISEPITESDRSGDVRSGGVSVKNPSTSNV